VWSISFGASTLWDRERLMTWRALDAALDNGATPIVVPLWDRIHQPITPKLTTTPFSDDTLWDDAVAWDQCEVEAAVTTAAVLRAIEITFSIAGPKPLVGGEFFSILHGGNLGWRMYEVIKVVSQAGGSATVKFRPPLRAAVATDTPLNFDTPRVVCRSSGDTAALLEMLRFGKGQAAFVECFPASLD
jgi:hypothetical protein